MSHDGHTHIPADRSTAWATWAAAIAAFLSFFSSAMTVYFMHEQSIAMKEQLQTTFDSVKYTKQYDLVQNYEDKLNAFRNIVNWLLYYAICDRDTNSSECLAGNHQKSLSVEYLHKSIDAIVEHSESLEQASQLLKMIFPQKISNVSNQISQVITKQVQEYQKIEREKIITPDKILATISRNADILGDYKSYLEGHDIKALRKCLEERLGEGRVVDGQSVLRCEFI